MPSTVFENVKNMMQVLRSEEWGTTILNYAEVKYFEIMKCVTFLYDLTRSTSESFYSAVRGELETSLNRLPLTQPEKT